MAAPRLPDVLLVDGYNVIYAWPELDALRQRDLAHARGRLIAIMADYGAFTGQQIIVVFDGHSAAGPPGVLVDGVEVIFTRRGETADSRIEKLAYLLCRSGRQVYVATSDWAEQTVVFGSGACRIPARELSALVRETMARIRQFCRTDSAGRRNDLESYLKTDILSRLRAWRKGH